MKKTTQALSITLALFLTCSNVLAKDCFKQEKVEIYAHPSLMNADATEVKDADHDYRIGGKVLKQKNRLGFTNKENTYVNAFAKDLLNAMSVRKGDRDFNIKMPISRAELAKRLGLSERQVRKIMDWLRSEDRLARKGGTTGEWIIIQ